MGVHLDLKHQMMKAGYIKDILHDLKRWGYNTALIEYMDKLPYKGDISMLSAPDALTAEEVTDIVSEADSLGIEIIPLVQCLGHAYWVLSHGAFTSLGEGFLAVNYYTVK